MDALDTVFKELHDEFVAGVQSLRPATKLSTNDPAFYESLANSHHNPAIQTIARRVAQRLTGRSDICAE